MWKILPRRENSYLNSLWGEKIWGTAVRSRLGAERGSGRFTRFSRHRSADSFTALWWRRRGSSFKFFTVDRHTTMLLLLRLLISGSSSSQKWRNVNVSFEDRLVWMLHLEWTMSHTCQGGFMWLRRLSSMFANKLNWNFVVNRMKNNKKTISIF